MSTTHVLFAGIIAQGQPPVYHEMGERSVYRLLPPCLSLRCLSAARRRPDVLLSAAQGLTAPRHAMYDTGRGRITASAQAPTACETSWKSML